MAEDVMMCEWVIGRYIGEQAKSVIAHANAGSGYFLLDQGKQGVQQTCLAAFRRAMDSPVPDHLDRVVDPFMVKKLNDRYEQRHGLEKRPTAVRSSVSPQKIQEIKDLFTKRKTVETRKDLS